MLNGNVHLLVEDIEALLNDICEFLGKNVNDGFSNEQKCLAEKLINRSKSQLQTIAKFTENISDPDTSYVDMTPKALPPKPEPKNTSLIENSAPEQIKECPYTSTSVSEAKGDNKCGYLERKRNRWFLASQVKEFAIVINGWLLLYTSEKDNKPTEWIDLEVYNLKFVPKDPKCKKETRSFQLHHTSSTKIYHFTAKNDKDMDQWITAINKTATIELNECTVKETEESKENVQLRHPKKPSKLKQLPPLPQIPSVPNPYIMNQSTGNNRESADNYDPVGVTTDKDDEDEENFYECPLNINSPKLPSIPKEQSPPNLPPPRQNNCFLHSPRKRNIQPLTPQSTKEEEDDDDEEEVEYDVPLNEKIEQTISNKFEISTTFSSPPKNNIEVTNTDDNLDEVYDEVISPPIPKPEIKPNVRSLINKMNTKPNIAPKLQPKPKFAGINRNPSYLLKKDENT